MFQSILDLWRDLPWIVRVPLDFFILFIFLRGVVADDITTWLKDRGLIKKGEKSLIYRSLDLVYEKAATLMRLIPNYERRTAIWSHYKNHLKGEGHADDNVISCSDGNCATI